jgi:hypothetical protein
MVNTTVIQRAHQAYFSQSHVSTNMLAFLTKRRHVSTIVLLLLLITWTKPNTKHIFKRLLTHVSSLHYLVCHISTHVNTHRHTTPLARLICLYHYSSTMVVSILSSWIQATNSHPRQVYQNISP